MGNGAHSGLNGDVLRQRNIGHGETPSEGVARNTEALQNGRQGTKLHWNPLELLNGLRRAQDALA
jgi:hypothetical protein